jgi:hypothetical protein
VQEVVFVEVGDTSSDFGTSNPAETGSSGGPPEMETHAQDNTCVLVSMPKQHLLSPYFNIKWHTETSQLEAPVIWT